MTGIELIGAERERQISQEGWTPEHDDTHKRGEMLSAAKTYLEACVLIPGSHTVEGARGLRRAKSSSTYDRSGACPTGANR